MGLKLTTCDPENVGLLILEVADGTAGSLLAFFEHWLMSFHSPCVRLVMLAINFRRPSLRRRRTLRIFTCTAARAFPRED